MARVQYGGGVTAFAGSLAGNTFQRNPGGEIVRARTRNNRSITLKQSTQQLRQFSQLVAWRNLTLGQQTQWNGFAGSFTRTNIFGQLKTLSGFNWFTLINQNLALQGEATISVPPTYAEPDAIEDVEITFPGGGLHIEGNFTALSDRTSVVIFTTGPLTRTVGSFRQFLRYTSIEVGDFDTFDFNIEAAWEATHGLAWPLPSPFNVVIGGAVYTLHVDSGVNSAALFPFNSLAG